MIMDKIRWFGLETEIDIFNTIQHIRNYRSQMVQSIEQYEFIYKAVKCYVQSLIVNEVSDVKIDDDDSGLLSTSLTSRNTRVTRRVRK